ncbi:hypothetical protein VP01_2284g1 [Puccinia sorghi]|uniref:Uncharacterized protein n=1 Tax=Puccinia sorghi TaxID=27349 RepID=A0A0L6V804_9BASI|nr:hypothetical protein VP01_2284g1 [Puccinia sorghi]
MLFLAGNQVFRPSKYSVFYIIIIASCKLHGTSGDCASAQPVFSCRGSIEDDRRPPLRSKWSGPISPQVVILHGQLAEQSPSLVVSIAKWHLSFRVYLNQSHWSGQLAKIELLVFASSSSDEQVILDLKLKCSYSPITTLALSIQVDCLGGAELPFLDSTREKPLEYLDILEHLDFPISLHSTPSLPTCQFLHVQHYTFFIAGSGVHLRTTNIQLRLLSFPVTTSNSIHRRLFQYLAIFIFTQRPSSRAGSLRILVEVYKWNPISLQAAFRLSNASALLMISLSIIEQHLRHIRLPSAFRTLGPSRPPVERPSNFLAIKLLVCLEVYLDLSQNLSTSHNTRAFGWRSIHVSY